nr:hypothetical protein [uncultured Carboxylicivirga sp.]
MVKYALIISSSFNANYYPKLVQNSFQDITHNDIQYKLLFAFEKYINDYPFDLVFDSQKTYETWLKSGIDKSIEKVEYNWKDNQALITIADSNFPGPHVFDCDSTWTETDCQAAINTKFP